MQEIKDYLSDNTDLSDAQINELAYDILHRLDYSPIYNQIDEILRQFSYTDDYAKSQG